MWGGLVTCLISHFAQVANPRHFEFGKVVYLTTSHFTSPKASMV